MAFCGRYLHMQPSEFAQLSNVRTGELVAATQDLLKAEFDERFELLKLQIQATRGVI